MLEPLGVGRIAEDVYRALLTHGPSDDARLADLVRADLDEVRKGMAELAELELAGPLDDASGRWHAGSPDVVIGSLVVRQQEALLQRQRELERAQVTVGELIRLSRSRGPGISSDAVEVITGGDAVRQRSGHLGRTAEQCTMRLDRLPYGAMPDEAYDPPAEAAELEQLRRGVEVQAIYEYPALLAPGRFDAVRHLAAAGIQARTLPELPMNLVVHDRATAIVQLTDDGPEDAPTVLLVHRSALLTGLVQLFELLWERAVALPPAPGDPLDNRGAEFDDALVALLAAGFKDESIARHLGISPSTVTRRVARLMEQSGASTRFQLGTQAVRRGWI